MKIFAATNNVHKRDEFADILQSCGLFLSPLSDIGVLPDVEEDGSTFEENASIKALAAANFIGDAGKAGDFLVFADDSGLVVEALDGRPGIYSARYAKTNDERIARVLGELQGVENRRAFFVCVVAVADSGGILKLCRGEVHGRIGHEPRGGFGFGYDPVFYPDGHDRTFAELGPEIKNSMSHRSAAVRQAGEFMKQHIQHSKSSIERPT